MEQEKRKMEKSKYFHSCVKNRNKRAEGKIKTTKTNSFIENELARKNVCIIKFCVSAL